MGTDEFEKLRTSIPDPETTFGSSIEQAEENFASKFGFNFVREKIVSQL